MDKVSAWSSERGLIVNGMKFEDADNTLSKIKHSKNRLENVYLAKAVVKEEERSPLDR